MYIPAETLLPFCNAFLDFALSGEKFEVLIPSRTDAGQGQHVTRGFRRSTTTYTISAFSERSQNQDSNLGKGNLRAINSHVTVENRNGIIFFATQHTDTGPYFVYGYPQMRVLQRILRQTTEE